MEMSLCALAVCSGRPPGGPSSSQLIWARWNGFVSAFDYCWNFKRSSTKTLLKYLTNPSLKMSDYRTCVVQTDWYFSRALLPQTSEYAEFPEFPNASASLSFLSFSILCRRSTFSCKVWDKLWTTIYSQAKINWGEIWQSGGAAMCAVQWVYRNLTQQQILRNWAGEWWRFVCVSLSCLKVQNEKMHHSPAPE